MKSLRNEGTILHWNFDWFLPFGLKLSWVFEQFRLENATGASVQKRTLQIRKTVRSIGINEFNTQLLF
jgi:hypothetical protein